MQDNFSAANTIVMEALAKLQFCKSNRRKLYVSQPAGRETTEPLAKLTEFWNIAHFTHFKK